MLTSEASRWRGVCQVISLQLKVPPKSVRPLDDGGGLAKATGGTSTYFRPSQRVAAKESDSSVAFLNRCFVPMVSAPGAPSKPA
jgi:hypothetical protein